MTTPARPMTRTEKRLHNQRQYEEKVQQELIARHGPDVGVALAWLRTMQARVQQAAKDGDTTLAHRVSQALSAIHQSHTP